MSASAHSVAPEPDGRVVSLQETTLAACIAETGARIRRAPTHAAHRWALFQLLCAACDWQRALQQLQVYAQLDTRQTSTAFAYRDLIRAESRRARVLDGSERPAVVFDAPSWMNDMLDALRLARDGQISAADDARERALDAAPLVAAVANDRHLDWIADSDTRLGPVCEIVAAGHYRWVPLSDIASWTIARPASLVDLLWAPCTLELSDDSTMHGFMPARYPDSTDTDDALRVGRTTRWREAGRTGIIASGQKTWASSAGDFGLFELPVCHFVDAPKQRQPTGR
ncbi:ImpE/SciE family protein [Burkholderia stagnalis]|uniref:type VI secretion system accessory protein TagJ n=1 Tax=Burkholderia stagnalis TaxID=1503054 RepID=UPI000759DC5E|nr:type VI secretion system accessory protein TagJ [Burkholderia stagnalis]KVN24085.1 ImpE/SciE family protein [Burkholderia stagnalis]